MITERMADALDYIRGYQAENRGVSPSVEQMKEALGLRSKSSVFRLLQCLEERGQITRLRYHARAIKVIQENER